MPAAIRITMMIAIAIPIFSALRMMTPTMKPSMRGRTAATRNVLDRSGSAKPATMVLYFSDLRRYAKPSAPRTRYTGMSILAARL